MGDVELDWLCEVVARHCPAFFIHPSDRYMPCSAEWFMERSELRQAAAGAGAASFELLLARGSVAGALLLEAQRQQAPGTQLRLHLDPAARTGMPQELLSEVPVYVHPKWIVGKDGSVEALEVQYLTLYAFNGAYNVGGLPFIQTGAHDGDWEHCTARLHPTTGELMGMWYNAHRSRDGSWVAGPEVPRDTSGPTRDCLGAPRHQWAHSRLSRCPETPVGLTGRIAAFVALHGHGVYPQPGRVLRHFLLGNDLCSRDGPVWRPRRVVLLPPRHQEQEGAAVEAGQPPAAIGSCGQDGGAVHLEAAPAATEPGTVTPSLESSLGALTLSQQQPSRVELLGQDPGPSSRGDGGAEPLVTPAGGAGLRRSRGSRKLLQAQSRGSELSCLAANAASAAGPDPESSHSPPEVVTNDSCAWLWFNGDWGTTPAPVCQSWFGRAETPLSRSSLLRIFGHIWPEPENV